MATISENLQTIADSTSAIKQAIIDKGGDASGDITTWANAINNIPSGGGGSVVEPVSQSDVIFLDYDGTILHSYTKEQFLALSAMPELPTREGLICQGWNWDLNDAKSYVRDYGMLNIGTMYITNDGDTRLYIRIATEGRMTVPLYWSQTVSSGVSIDWGDGSTIQSVSGTGNKNTTHTYAKPGDYVIRLKVANGCALGLGGGSSSYCVMGATDDNGKVYCNMLQKVEIGTSVTSVGTYAFYYCYSLASVTIPSSVTNIGSNAFQNCYSLASVTIPSSVTSIGDIAFQNCYSLASVTIASGVTSIGSSAFYYCHSLASVTIPSSVTSIGAYAFQNCYSLASITIASGVTSIGSSAFYYCHSLASVTIPSSVTSIGNTAFSNCYSLASVTIASGVTSIGSNAFSNCHSLASVTIASGVTSIGNTAFSNCYSLASVTIPSSVTSIGAYAFRYCYGMAIYDFTKHTSVPTLANTNAFGSIPSDCIIKVPSSLLSAWKSATNWSTYASKIVAV